MERGALRRDGRKNSRPCEVLRQLFVTVFCTIFVDVKFVLNGLDRVVQDLLQVLFLGRSNQREFAYDGRELFGRTLNLWPGEPLAGTSEPVDSCETDNREHGDGRVVEVHLRDRLQLRQEQQDADEHRPHGRDNAVQNTPLAEIPRSHLEVLAGAHPQVCLLYTSPSPRDRTRSRMPSSA